MRWSIDEEVLAENNLTFGEFLFLLFNTKDGDVYDCINTLEAKGWGNKDLFDNTKIVLSNKIKTKVVEMLVDSNKLVDNEERFNNLADKLREIFPEGRKPGTTYSWRGSTIEVAKKLKTLIVNYGCKFTDEEAVEATKAYVSSWNGDYKFMKLLKYFILKTKNGERMEKEIQSDLMAFIQNKQMDQQVNGNWAVNLA